MGHPRLLFHLFSSFPTSQQNMWKMTILYTVLGFEPTTFRTRVSSTRTGLPPFACVSLLKTTKWKMFKTSFVYCRKGLWWESSRRSTWKRVDNVKTWNWKNKKFINWRRRRRKETKLQKDCTMSITASWFLPECDQIGRFLKVFGFKSGPNICQFSKLLWKALLSKNCSGSF